jgi:soluble lytic murein transglycosylase
VTEKKRVGTVKVKVKGKKKPVSKPKYQFTKKSVKLVNLPLQIKKENYERTYVERLKDLLDPGSSREIRKDALVTLVTIAEAKSQDAYMRQLIPELVKLDRLADAGLQRFWDKAWSAYSAGDLATARELFTFIKDTYTNPNIRRQSTYWLARIDERSGKKAEAAAAFQRLADSAYEDLYARYAEKHGAKRTKSGKLTLAQSPDWTEVAERSMPAELRLAHELNALGVHRESRLEVQENARDSNRKWADALLGQIFHAEGNHEAAYRFLRRAYPELATIEQQQVPRQILRMYYPLKYYDWIVEYSKQRGLDPFLVMALIRQESSYNPNVKSAVNATGLMQIMPATGNELARKLHKFGSPKLTDPKTNIELGTFYLKTVISWVGGSEELALAAYNGGIGNVRKWQGAFRGKRPDEFIESIPFSETRGYVKRITMMRSTYEELHDELRTSTP